MTNSFAPKTEIELENWMQQNCYNFNSYSINGNLIYEGFGIDKINGIYIWYYTERGQKSDEATFLTESEVVEHAFTQIKNDKWAKSHCVGFVFDKAESDSLSKILKDKNIEFFQDEIPYYGPNKPAFRTFVYGCDIKELTEIQKKYTKE